MKKKIEIIYQDDELLIINKPAHFLSIPDRYKPDLPNAKAYLQHRVGEVYTVHRIDKETSGIMIFARNESSHKHLCRQFEERKVNKLYWALTMGQVQPATGEINKPIASHPGKPGKMIIARKGKQSLTTYRTLEAFRHYSLIEANIKTGRTHQIRVHFESIGHPLAVDPMYGGSEGFYLSELKGKKYRRGKSDKEERPLMGRVSLHAYSISFKHPTSGEKMHYEAELPKDFRAVLSQLRKLG